MVTSTTSLQASTNVRIASKVDIEFYKINYIKTDIVQGISDPIPNTSPTMLDVFNANESLDKDIEEYVNTFYPFDPDYMDNESYICYEVNRDIMSPSGASHSCLYAQVDIYQVVKSTNNAIR
jgi:hypothetical protein